MSNKNVQQVLVEQKRPVSWLALLIGGRGLFFPLYMYTVSVTLITPFFVTSYTSVQKFAISKYILILINAY